MSDGRSTTGDSQHRDQGTHHEKSRSSWERKYLDLADVLMQNDQGVRHDMHDKND